MDISAEVIEKARVLMRERTRTNGAPAWGLTEIAIRRGEELAKEYGVNVSLITVALYLAHIVFSNVRGSETMKNHDMLSAQEAEQKLLEWGVVADVAAHVRKAIALHHSQADSGDLFCEVMKNAECSKFLTERGLRVFIDSLMEERGMTLEEAVDYARFKMYQKCTYLTLEKVKQEANTNLPVLEEMLSKV